MINRCPYCDQLKSAISSENYCSHRRDDLYRITSNAFTFSEHSLSSGSHISRFSLRAIYNGYQYYQVSNREYVLNSNQFLVVREGESFENLLEQEQQASGIVVAFNPDFIKYYLYYINNSEEKILDNPFEKLEASLYFFEGSYEKSLLLDQYLRQVIRDINQGEKESLYYQNMFVNILDELVGIKASLNEKIDKISAKKRKTRVELYRRLSTAKDYIDANLEKKLSLEQIAQYSCLSPFHFLRSFFQFYDITPYQYILTERLKKAHFLISSSSKDVSQIMRMTGFDNKRTFQRSFQKKYGTTPYALLST